MSKTQLKKFLNTLNHDQITEMVLELYAARKEAKDYLDYSHESRRGENAGKISRNHNQGVSPRSRQSQGAHIAMPQSHQGVCHTASPPLTHSRPHAHHRRKHHGLRPPRAMGQGVAGECRREHLARGSRYNMEQRHDASI